MSLWTPDGERAVPGGDGAAGAGGPSGTAGGPELTADQQLEAQQIAAEMSQVREQLSQVPAAVVIANHAMGCYELAAIHLSAQPPKFAEAQLAIDGFGALLGVLDGHLGPDEATLADALAQIRLAFVQVKASWESAAPTDDGDTAGADGPTEG